MTEHLSAIKTPEARQPIWRKISAGLLALTVASGATSCSSEDDRPTRPQSTEWAAPTLPVRSPAEKALGERPRLSKEAQQNLARYGNYASLISGLQEAQPHPSGNYYRLRWIAKIACYKGEDPHSTKRQYREFKVFLSEGYAEAWRDLSDNLKNSFDGNNVYDGRAAMPKVPRTLEGAQDTFPDNRSPEACENWAVEHGLPGSAG